MELYRLVGCSLDVICKASADQILQCKRKKLLAARDVIDQCLQTKKTVSIVNASHQPVQPSSVDNRLIRPSSADNQPAQNPSVDQLIRPSSADNQPAQNPSVDLLIRPSSADNQPAQNPSVDQLIRPSSADDQPVQNPSVGVPSSAGNKCVEADLLSVTDILSIVSKSTKKALENKQYHPLKSRVDHLQERLCNAYEYLRWNEKMKRLEEIDQNSKIADYVKQKNPTEKKSAHQWKEKKILDGIMLIELENEFTGICVAFGFQLRLFRKLRSQASSISIPHLIKTEFPEIIENACLLRRRFPNEYSNLPSQPGPSKKRKRPHDEDNNLDSEGGIGSENGNKDELHELHHNEDELHHEDELHELHHNEDELHHEDELHAFHLDSQYAFLTDMNMDMPIYLDEHYPIYTDANAAIQYF